MSHKLLRDHTNYGRPTYCVVWKKYETEETEERGRVLNKELVICGIVSYIEIKKHGHVFCKRVMEVCTYGCMIVLYDETVFRDKMFLLFYRFYVAVPQFDGLISFLND